MEKSEGSFHTYLEALGREYPRQRFLLDDGHSYSYASALCEVDALAGFFLQNGLRSGSLVALRASRSLESALLFFALQAIGVISVLTDPHQGVHAYLAANAPGLPISVFLTNEIPKKEGLLKRSGILKILWGKREGIAWGKVQNSASLFCHLNLLVSPQSPTIIIFTSGTTGKSKMVALSQYAFINNSLDTAIIGDYRPDDLAVELLPLNHVFGLALLSTALVNSHAVYFPHDLAMAALFSLIEREKITRMNGVPTLYSAMASFPERHHYDISSLRVGLIGGGPCPKELMAYLEGELGLCLVPVYGMSEFIGISCGDYRDRIEERSASVGRVYSMNELRIVNGKGAEMARGKEGEITVKGPAMMNGYYGEGPFTDDLGFFHTGDLGYLDKRGILHLTGRSKDIIIKSGLKIASAKVENALLALPFVKEAAVVGIADPYFGEVPAAGIVLKAGVVIGEEKIKALLAEKLLKYEIPEVIRFFDVLPKTFSGKIDKIKLKESFGC